MRSMTGHGRGAASGAGRDFTVEARSVNHRFLDVKLRAPGSLDPRAEDTVVQTVRRRAERGAFTISVTVREQGAVARSGVRVDVDAARQAHAALDELRRALGYAEPVPLELLLAQPGVLVTADLSDLEPSLPTLAAAVDLALVELCEMRKREGAALAADLVGRLDRLAELAGEIGAQAVSMPAELGRRLEDRLAKLLAERAGVVDESRLAAEVALLADRSDVTEELVRLRAHLAALRSAVGEDAAVGRRLDFLVQEVGRELNTIGSKSQSADITRRVVDGKAELEKIREQIQNVE